MKDKPKIINKLKKILSDLSLTNTNICANILINSKKWGINMTIYKLMDILKKVNHTDMNIARLRELKDFTDEEIDFIFSATNKREVIQLLKNTDFRNQPKETQKKLIELIGNSTKDNIILFYAIDVATDKTAINSGHIIEIIEIIFQLTNTDKIRMISAIATNQIATRNEDMLKVIKMIAESNLNEDILTYAEMLIKNEYAYRAGNLLESITAILNAKNENEARSIWSNKINEGLDTNLLDALDKKQIDSINFWDLLIEDYQTAINLLMLAKFPKSLIFREINVENREEYENLMNKYYLENIKMTSSETVAKSINEELSPSIKVRRK